MENNTEDDDIVYVGTTYQSLKISSTRAAKIKAEVNLEREEHYRKLRDEAVDNEVPRGTERHSAHKVSAQRRTSNIDDFFKDKKFRYPTQKEGLNAGISSVCGEKQKISDSNQNPFLTSKVQVELKSISVISTNDSKHDSDFKSIPVEASHCANVVDLSVSRSSGLNANTSDTAVILNKVPDGSIYVVKSSSITVDKDKITKCEQPLLEYQQRKESVSDISVINSSKLPVIPAVSQISKETVNSDKSQANTIDTTFALNKAAVVSSPKMPRKSSLNLKNGKTHAMRDGSVLEHHHRREDDEGPNLPVKQQIKNSIVLNLGSSPISIRKSLNNKEPPKNSVNIVSSVSSPLQPISVLKTTKSSGDLVSKETRNACSMDREIHSEHGDKFVKSSKLSLTSQNSVDKNTKDVCFKNSPVSHRLHLKRPAPQEIDEDRLQSPHKLGKTDTLSHLKVWPSSYPDSGPSASLENMKVGDDPCDLVVAGKLKDVEIKYISSEGTRSVSENSSVPKSLQLKAQAKNSVVPSSGNSVTICKSPNDNKEQLKNTVNIVGSVLSPIKPTCVSKVPISSGDHISKKTAGVYALDCKKIHSEPDCRFSKNSKLDLTFQSSVTKSPKDDCFKNSPVLQLKRTAPHETNQGRLQSPLKLLKNDTSFHVRVRRNLYPDNETLASLENMEPGNKSHHLDVVGTPKYDEPETLSRDGTPSVTERSPIKKPLPLKASIENSIVLNSGNSPASLSTPTKAPTGNRIHSSPLYKYFSPVNKSQKLNVTKIPSICNAIPSVSSKLSSPNRSSSSVTQELKEPDTIHVLPSNKLQKANQLPESVNNETRLSPEEDIVSPFSVFHFRNIIVQILSNNDDQPSFHPDIIQFLNAVEEVYVRHYFVMSEKARELYIRMYNRKFTWHRLSNIKYNFGVEQSETNDLTQTSLSSLEQIVKELEIVGFVQTDVETEDLGELLNLLTVTEMRILCKEFRIAYLRKNKQQMKESILQCAKKQTTLPFGFAKGADGVIRAHMKKILGNCLKLCEEPRAVFRRLMLLYFMSFGEEEGGLPIFRMLQVERGEVVYPPYKITKSRQIFANRDCLVRYQEAHDMEMELLSSIGKEKADVFEDLVLQIRAYFINIMMDAEQSLFVENLPVFLRYFTAGSSCAYALHSSIERLKKLGSRGIDHAVDILSELLGQKLYLPYYRGQWYEELALLYLKKKDVHEAASVVEEAVTDPLVDELYIDKLTKRGERLLKNKRISIEMKKRLREIIMKQDEEDSPPFIQIKAKAVFSNIPGRKAVYLLEDQETQEKTYLSVEEMAINHYRSLGFTKGVHAEGSIVNTLFGLFFWDILYELDIPDVFLNPYQSVPLDLRTGEFYCNRKEVIDRRLIEMKSWTVEKINSEIERRYTENDGISCIINWQWFNNFQEVLDLIHCMGMDLVTKLCERLAKSFRVARSGFPDLVLWTPGESKCKFVEVKGPGDSLSDNQKLWMKFLISVHANAEICYVITTGSTDIR